jgi:menaquinone-specific isochorismate synthase
VTARLTVTTRPLADDRALVTMLPVDDGLLFTRGDMGLAGWGVAARLPVDRGPDRLAVTAAALDDLASAAHVDDTVGVPGGGLIAFASLTFDPEAGGSVVVIPRRVVGRVDGVTFLTRIDGPGLSDDVPGPATSTRPEPVRDRVRFAGSSLPDVLWLDAVAQAIKRIDDGDLDKVVLARDHAVWSRHPLDARWLARRLGERFPDCFTFLVDGLIGATPELLVRRQGDQVLSVALAGTTARLEDPAADARAGAALLASDKDRREHDFAVRSVTAALAPVCADLTASEEPFLMRLDNVAHLASEVRGTLAGPTGVLDLLDRVHPTAAVGGTPRDRAITVIRELEGMDRGRYAGPVGWVAAGGDGEFGIALRCAELSGARARLFAGAGVVAGSLPEDELEETRVKLRAMQGALDA